MKIGTKNTDEQIKPKSTVRKNADIVSINDK